jgi:hypothetical protein
MNQIDFHLLKQRHDELGAAKTTVNSWKQGSRPQARFMPKIAVSLNLPFETLVEALWKERVGDPCPCGCGGKKVFPVKFPTARTLFIELPCARCRRKRISHQAVQGGHRKFCQRCAHAGEEAHLAVLMKRLGFPESSFYPWLRGEYRPPWESLQKIINNCGGTGMSPLDVLKQFWRESVGDPCPCGCGGKKVLPDDPKARALAIELPCVQCGDGDIRRYRYQTEGHYKLCRTCSRSNERVDRSKFTCDGYEYKGVKARSETCRREMLLAPNQVKKRQQKKERNPNSYFDVSSGKYRCANCTRSLQRLSYLEGTVKNFLAKKQPHIKVERIRNRQQLSKLLSANFSEMNPNLRPDVEKIRNRRRRLAPGVSRVHLIRWWSRPPKDLPTFVRFGLCGCCGKIAITLSDIPKFHWRCYHEWMRTPEGRHFQSLGRRGQKRGQEANPPVSKLELRVRVPVGGMSGTEDSLKISFSWAVQHCLEGKSYRTIAEENDVDHTSVRDRIQFLIDKLPDPDLLQPRWQRAVRFLLDASEKNSARSATALNG